MAITRPRLAFLIPWRRAAGESIAPDLTSREGPAAAAGPASSRRSRRIPPRGPDGRFIRRAATAVTLDAEARSASPAAPAAVAIPAPLAAEPLAPRPIRIVLVEEVPDVAAHVREMLRSQPRFKLVQVVADGGKAIEAIRDLEPDVVLVDSLLQGRIGGSTVAERLRAGGSPVGIVALTVPDHPVDGLMSRHADAVVTLPFGTIDLGRALSEANAAAITRNPAASPRIVAVFSAKGGVGKTTIAYNLAASLGATGLRTLLVDGSLQFGDVRRLVRADPTAPSICDLPTDLVRGSDLADTVVRDPSGIDLLLAPPRPELADLVSNRDLGRVVDLLRRAYQAIVIDTPSTLSAQTLAFLDAADVIINVLTADSATLDLTRTMVATFAEVGYPAAKVRYLVNRSGTVGAAPASQVTEAIGREPDYAVASDWQLVSSSNGDGVPFVLARPGATVSSDLALVAEDLRALAVAPVRSLPAYRRARSA